MPTNRQNAYRALQASPAFRSTPRGVAYGSGLGAAPPLTNATAKRQARVDFVRWFAAAHPKLVAALIAKLEPKTAQASGLGQAADALQPIAVNAQTVATTSAAATSSPSLIDKLISAASSIVPAYLANQQQKAILNAQLSLAQQGKPPLTTGQYAPTMQVGLSDATIANIANAAQQKAKSAFTNPWVLGGLALAVGGIWYFSHR